MTTRTCLPRVYAMYSAAVKARRGVMIRSMLHDQLRTQAGTQEPAYVGSEAKLMNRVALAIAPDSWNSCRVSLARGRGRQLTDPHEESSSLLVDTQSSENQVELFLLTALLSWLFDQAGLSTNLGCDLNNQLLDHQWILDTELTSLWGRPAALKIGIFCPRAIEFITSMVEIP